jgi:hypothetical protein
VDAPVIKAPWRNGRGRGGEGWRMSACGVCSKPDTSISSYIAAEIKYSLVGGRGVSTEIPQMMCGEGVSTSHIIG